jgi:hypothetical protein
MKFRELLTQQIKATEENTEMLSRVLNALENLDDTPSPDDSEGIKDDRHPDQIRRMPSVEAGEGGNHQGNAGIKPKST